MKELCLADGLTPRSTCCNSVQWACLFLRYFRTAVKDSDTSESCSPIPAQKGEQVTCMCAPNKVQLFCIILISLHTYCVQVPESWKNISNLSTGPIQYTLVSRHDSSHSPLQLPLSLTRTTWPFYDVARSDYKSHINTDLKILELYWKTSLHTDPESLLPFTTEVSQKTNQQTDSGPSVLVVEHFTCWHHLLVSTGLEDLLPIGLLQIQGRSSLLVHLLYLLLRPKVYLGSKNSNFFFVYRFNSS